MKPRISGLILAAAAFPAAGCKNVTSLLNTSHSSMHHIKTGETLPGGGISFQEVNDKGQPIGKPSVLKSPVFDLDPNKFYTACWKDGQTDISVNSRIEGLGNLTCN
jgi:hypothetical protein